MVEEIRITGNTVSIVGEGKDITEFIKETEIIIEGLQKQIVAIQEIIDSKKEILKTINDTK